MAFSKPFAGTFSYKGLIPSSAMNTINNAIPNALDKTGDNAANGGGITGSIDVLSGAVVNVVSGGKVIANGGQLQATNSGLIYVDGTSAFTTALGSASNFNGVAYFNDGLVNTSGTGTLYWAGAVDFTNVTNGALTFGQAPSISPALNKSRFFFLEQMYYQGAWTNGSATVTSGQQSLVGNGAGALAYFTIPAHQNATITSVTMFYKIPTGHFPGTGATLSVNVGYTVIATGSVVSLLPGATYTSVPGTNAATYAQGGGIISTTFTCNAYNTIDALNNSYFVQVKDESGAGGVAGNLILGFQINYTNITSLAFA